MIQLIQIIRHLLKIAAKSETLAQAKSDQASTGNTEMEKKQNCSPTHKVKPREEVGKGRDFFLCLRLY